MFLEKNIFLFLNGYQTKFNLPNNQEQSLSQAYVNELSQQIIYLQNVKMKLGEKIEDFLQN